MTAFPLHIAVLLLLSGSPDQPKELLNQSVQEFQAGDYPSAHHSLVQLIAAYPQIAPAHNLLGLVFMEEQKYTEAIRQFDTVLRLQPDSVSAHVNRGNALVALHQDDKARLEYMKALSLRPTDTQALSGVGFIYARAHNQSAAAPFLEDAHRLDATNAGTTSALAAVYLDLHRFSEAEALVDDLLRAGAATRDVRFSLAAVALKNGNPELGAKCVTGDQEMQRNYYDLSYSKAFNLANGSNYREALQVLLALSPDTQRAAAYHDLLGTIYYRLDEPAKSVAELQEAIRLEPSNPDHYFKLGMMFVKHHTGDGAILVFDAALKVHPEDPKLWMGLGLSYYVQNDMRSAREKLYHAISIDAKYGPAYVVLCDVLSQTAADDEMLGIIGKAIEVEPGDYLLRYYYGKSLARKGDRDAIDELRRAIALNPEFADSYFELGKVFLNKGDALEAIDILTKCIKINPKMAEAHYILSRAYDRLGRKDLAAIQIAAFGQLRKEDGGEERIQQLIFTIDK